MPRILAARTAVSQSAFRFAGPGDLEQAGIEERDFQLVGGKFSRKGLDFCFREEGNLLLRLGNVAEFHPAEPVLVGEGDGLALGPTDLVSEGGEAGFGDFAPERLCQRGRGEGAKQFPTGE